MAQWLFPNSLADPEVYADARRHWLDFWLSIDSARRWRTPWVENAIPDGNPIFTAASEARAVRIIQEDPRDPDDIDLDWWLDSAEEPTLPELVIACCPSVENTPEVERLLREWMTTGRVSESVGDHHSNGNGESAITNKISSP